MDFTIDTYLLLLNHLLNAGYRFQTVEEFVQSDMQKVVALRHDVDRRPAFALRMAILEHSLDIRGTYYFRIVPASNKPAIISDIVELGHEIGYHYEDLSIERGDREKAFSRFISNLEYFRKFYPVKTCCMHGSPMSKWDNRDLWRSYSYKQQGIIAEPYLDLNYNNILYLTDTGRRWDGSRFSVRDKVNRTSMDESPDWPDSRHIRKTMDIIEAIREELLPSRLMITLHPQRWTNNRLWWLQELVLQNIKNYVKKHHYT